MCGGGDHFCAVLTIGRGSHSTNATIKQQGGQAMSNSVKRWWPKVAAVAGADTEQAVLDLKDLMCCM